MTRARSTHPALHPRQLKAAALLGVTLNLRGEPHLPQPHRARVKPLRDIALAIARDLPTGHIALITGPSGAGKSTLLRALASACRASGSPVIREASVSSSRAVAAIAAAPLLDWLALLSQLGLAEAGPLLNAPRTLSTGQGYRLNLARSLARAQHAARPGASRPVTVILDEFAAPLDRLTAASVSVGLRRLIARSTNLRAVIATAHDDLTMHIRPMVHVFAHLTGSPTVRTRARPGDRRCA